MVSTSPSYVAKGPEPANPAPRRAFRRRRNRAKPSACSMQKPMVERSRVLRPKEPEPVGEWIGRGEVAMTAARKYLASKANPRKVRPTAYVAINCLLLTKASGTPKNGDPLPQEDVDAYLAALKDQIEAHVPLPPERSRLLSRYDVAAWRRLASAHCGALRYRIYRTPEDLLLVSVGHFEHNGPYVPNSREGVSTGEEADVGRSPNWYHFSYTYGELLENPTAAMGGLLEKLTVAVERYHKMLSH